MKGNLHETDCKQMQIELLKFLCIIIFIEHSNTCDSRTNLNHTHRIKKPFFSVLSIELFHEDFSPAVRTNAYANANANANAW